MRQRSAVVSQPAEIFAVGGGCAGCEGCGPHRGHSRSVPPLPASFRVSRGLKARRGVVPQTRSRSAAVQAFPGSAGGVALKYIRQRHARLKGPRAAPLVCFADAALSAPRTLRTDRRAAARPLPRRQSPTRKAFAATRSVGHHCPCLYATGRFKTSSPCSQSKRS